MHIINQEDLSKISFPDYNVEKMEYLPQEKTLRIFVDGAWVKTGFKQGYDLGPGILFFNDWESLTIKRYYPNIEEGIEVKEVPVEPLKDLCKVEFSNTNVTLCGFSIESWMEWEIINVKMHAEFDDYVEDLDWKPKTSR